MIKYLSRAGRLFGNLGLSASTNFHPYHFCPSLFSLDIVYVSVINDTISLLFCVLIVIVVEYVKSIWGICIRTVDLMVGQQKMIQNVPRDRVDETVV